MQDPFESMRQAMVDYQIAARGVRDERILEALRQVPRHLFVPRGYERAAYDDMPLPIGAGQTISQPYIVAMMTAMLEPGPQDRILEIGAGSGVPGGGPLPALRARGHGRAVAGGGRDGAGEPRTCRGDERRGPRR